MLGRMAGPGGGGVSEQRRREAAFDFSRRTDTAAVPSMPPPPMAVPPKLFLAAGSGGSGVSGEEALFSPPAELAGAKGGFMMVSPTSTLQAPAGSPATSAAAMAVPFSRHGSTSPSSSGGDDRRRGCGKSRSWSRSQQRPWEARPIGVGLAGALNDDGDALPPPATTVLTIGQRIIRPCRSSASSSSALGSSPESRSRSRCRRVLSPREEMEASSEDYTRVIARGPNPRTTHIFDDRVVVVEEDEFLRWCHGCSKDLVTGNTERGSDPRPGNFVPNHGTGTRRDGGRYAGGTRPGESRTAAAAAGRPRPLRRLVVADVRSELSLLNPVTDAQVLHPPTATLPFVDARHGADGRIESYGLRTHIRLRDFDC